MKDQRQPQQTGAPKVGALSAVVRLPLHLQRLLSGLAVGFLLWLIRGYQRLVAPLLGPCCRFTPSCSVYAAQSLKKYGLLKGVGKTIWRLLRCQPFCKGGYDPP